MGAYPAEGERPNGAALAAFLAAGIGGFAMGLIVILSETGLFVPPTLYQPAGGVTGRTALAVVLWLVAWAVLHSRWGTAPSSRPRCCCWSSASCSALLRCGGFSDRFVSRGPLLSRHHTARSSVILAAVPLRRHGRSDQAPGQPLGRYTCGSVATSIGLPDRCSKFM
jgi:hypothetical protein